jgi:hypothetical protein
VTLDSGHLFTSLGQRGDEGGHRQHVGRQGLASVLAAPGSEAAPVASVGALHVGGALLPRVHIPSARFGIVVDVTGSTDGLRGSKLRKSFH